MPSRIESTVRDVDSPNDSPDAFHRLVEDLSKVLGPSSGLDSAEIDPANLEKLMEEYVSKKNEWRQYALGDSTRTYTRNLVDRGNGKSNLVRHWSSNSISHKSWLESSFSSGHQAKGVPYTIMRMHIVWWRSFTP